jgi:hypothetical protein
MFAPCPPGVRREDMVVNARENQHLTGLYTLGEILDPWCPSGFATRFSRSAQPDLVAPMRDQTSYTGDR